MFTLLWFSRSRRFAPQSGRPGREDVGSDPLSLPPTDAQVGKHRLYDLGALEALFHHAHAARKKKGTAGRSRLEFLPPTLSSDDGTEKEPDCTWGEGALGPNLRVNDDETGGSKKENRHPVGRKRSTLCKVSSLAGGCERESFSDSKAPSQSKLVPLKSVRIFAEIKRRVVNLETEMPKRGSNEITSEENGGGPSRSHLLPRRGLQEKATSLSPAVGIGGAFARLVVIKELQPVPEHAPDDACRLLELTLDQHQVICVNNSLA